MNMARKRNEADGRRQRLFLLLAGILLVSAVLLSGCGAPKAAEPDGGAESPSSASETAAVDDGDACVIAADDFSNLQLSDPTVPVYDRYTLSERRAKGLTTVMPDLTPYKEGKVVYLTFDDGPDDKNTPAILDILKENGVHATFYVTGQHAELHPDVL